MKSEEQFVDIINSALNKNNITFKKSNKIKLKNQNFDFLTSNKLVNLHTIKKDLVYNLASSSSERSNFALMICEEFLNKNPTSNVVYIDVYNRSKQFITKFNFDTDKFSLFVSKSEEEALIILDTCIKEASFIVLDSMPIKTIESLFSKNIENIDREYQTKIFRNAIKKAANTNIRPCILVLSDAT